MVLQINKTKSVISDEHDFIDQLSHQLLTSATKLRLIDHTLAQEHPLTEQSQRQVREALATVIKQLLYAGQIASSLNESTGSAEALPSTPLDIVELIDELIGTFKLQNLNGSISVYCPEEPLFVWGNAGHLRVVLDNLISNALKYSDGQSPIIVSAEQHKELIDKDNGHVLVSVTNYGSYILPEEQEKIFNKSYRSQNSNQPGQGLGLYLSRNLVELHDGQLEVESSPTDGTTFWFTLPLCPLHVFTQKEGI